jgi:hypothetical protein
MKLQSELHSVASTADSAITQFFVMNAFHKVIMMDIDTSSLKLVEDVVIVEIVKLGIKKVFVKGMENK